MRRGAGLRSGVGGAAFTDPRSIGGCDLWLDGPSLGLTTGAAVASWTDKSGAGAHAVQATGSRRPLYKTAPVDPQFSVSNINLRTTGFVTFDGADDLLVAPLTPSTGRTIFIVARAKNTGSGVAVGLSAVNGISNRVPQGWTWNATPLPLVDRRTWTILELHIPTRATIELSASGRLVASVATDAGGGAFTQLGLGDYPPSGGVAGQIDIAEVISYNRPLSPVERQVVTTSLRAKYRINWRARQLGASVAHTYLEPWDYSSTPTPLMLFHHGYTEGGASILSDEIESPGAFTYQLLEAGVIVAGSDQHDNNWGSQAAVDDAVELYGKITERRPISKVVHWGNSMGGLSSLNTIRDGRIPVDGWMGMCAASDLANMYAGSYTATIKAAYGIAADGSDYASKTSGHDPNLIAAASFPATRYREYYASGDAAVPKEAHALAFITKMTGRAVEISGYMGTGGHQDPSVWNIADMMAYVRRCLA